MLCTFKNGTIKSLILTLNMFKRIFFSILFDMVLRTVMQKFCKVLRPMLHKFCMVWRLMLQKFCRVWGPSVQKFCTPWRPVQQKFSTPWRLVPQKLCTPWSPVLQKFYTPWRLVLQKFCTPWRPALQKFCTPRRTVLRRRWGHLKPNCKDSAPIVFGEMATLVPFPKDTLLLIVLFQCNILPIPPLSLSLGGIWRTKILTDANQMWVSSKAIFFKSWQTYESRTHVFSSLPLLW